MTLFETKLKNIDAMQAECGYDVTIVCASDQQQAKFWQQRLTEGKGTVVPTNSAVVVVDEDWEGGAGNFLGTLYAWKKACAKHKEATSEDLAVALSKGASVALFHTAGKGTRMAPLPGSENNNKPGVKLPTPGCPSILESVIRQTGAYANSRKGRLSVYWGDQVFIPSVDVAYNAEYHADILCAPGAMPTAEEWAARGLHKYGLIASRGDSSVAMMLEKVSHEQATSQLAHLTGVDRVGPSLGSFSLSAAFLFALEEGFQSELGLKEGKMDSDPHVWMPMTVAPDDYVKLMIEKEWFDEKGAKAHHQRIRDIISKFEGKPGNSMKGMFGTVPVGPDMSFWDFGQVRLYLENSILLTKDTDEAKLARRFFGISDTSKIERSSVGSCEVDAVSIVMEANLGSGKVTSSCLSRVTTGDVQAEGAVLVKCCAKRIQAAKGALAYNVIDESEEGIVLSEGEIRVGVFTDKPGESSYFEMRSNWDKYDGGKVFKERVCGNKFSFQEVYNLNIGVDVTQCSNLANSAYSKLSASISAP